MPIPLKEYKSYIDYKKLINRIDSDVRWGIDLKYACEDADINLSSYYRIKKALKNSKNNIDFDIVKNKLKGGFKRVDVKIEKVILSIVFANPKFGKNKIAEVLSHSHNINIHSSTIHGILKRHNLTSNEARHKAVIENAPLKYFLNKYLTY